MGRSVSDIADEYQSGRLTVQDVEGRILSSSYQVNEVQYMRRYFPSLASKYADRLRETERLAAEAHREIDRFIDTHRDQFRKR